LAALYAPEHSFFPEEERLLATYARQAAVALDVATALEQERDAVQRLRQDGEGIRHLAYHDALTGLPNGRMFSQELEAAVARSEQVAVLFCDLDRFKNVNDSLGHTRGDELLCLAAERLRACAGGALVARLGGDEFALLVHRADGEAVARRVIDGLTAPFRVADRDLYVSASIGIALHPGDGADGPTLLMNADAAMYEVKRSGRSGARRYEPAMTTARLTVQ
jgi:diguanylate cyclase (GGDEF)-like protein